MLLSKPITALMLAYLDQLFSHPIRTRALTNSALSFAAGNIAKYLHDKSFNDKRGNLIYALYGLIFGGTVQRMVKRFILKTFDVNLAFLQKYLIDRFIETPINLCLVLYFLSRFELQTHRQASDHLKQLCIPLLKSNWKHLSLLVFLNMYYAPVLIQPFTAGCIYYSWMIYVAFERSNQILQDRKAKENSTASS